jgi:hypothetical protein
MVSWLDLYCVHGLSWLRWARTDSSLHMNGTRSAALHCHICLLVVMMAGLIVSHTCYVDKPFAIMLSLDVGCSEPNYSVDL